jgi:hypothetical protein
MAEIPVTVVEQPSGHVPVVSKAGGSPVKPLFEGLVGDKCVSQIQ